jgi:hypothetical protein
VVIELSQVEKISKQAIDTFITYDPNKSYTVTEKRGNEVLSEKVYRKNNETGEYILK